MISQVKFFDDLGNEITIGVGFKIDVFPIRMIRKDGGVIRNYLPGKTSGIKWLANDQEVVKSRCLFGYPSINLKYMIAIYPIKDVAYSSPNNAVIYTAGGHVHKVLSPSAFVSGLLTSRVEENPPKPYMPDSLFFDNVGWRQSKNGEILTYIRIVYNREWFEDRILDPESGEIGGCVSSGKI